MFKIHVKYLLVTAVFFISEVAKAQQITDSVLTLQQCLDIGIKNNLTIKQTAAQTEASRVYWQQARENLLPSLNGDINHSISEGRSLNPFTNGYLNQPITSASYGLGSSLILSSGFTLQNAIRQTALAYQAGQMDLEQAKNTLTLNLIVAYLQVLSAEDQLEQAYAQAEVSQKQLDRALILDKDGAIQPQALYDLKGQFAGDQLGEINAKNAFTLAKLTVLQMLNVPYRNDIKFQRQATAALSSVYAESAQQVYITALQNFAFVKAGSLRRESAEKALKVARGAMLPTLSLSGGISTNYSSAAQRSVFVDSGTVATNQFIQTSTGRQTIFALQANYIGQDIGYYDQFRNNYSTSIRLGLSIPILNYFQNRNKITLAKLSLQTARDNEDASRLQLKVNIDQAYANMSTAYERYELLLNQTDAYAESFRIAEARFNAGAINSVEYVVVKSNLDRTRINLINARYDYLIRTKILDYYQGKLAL